MATEFTKEFSSVLNGMEKERIARENKKEQALIQRENKRQADLSKAQAAQRKQSTTDASRQEEINKTLKQFLKKDGSQRKNVSKQNQEIIDTLNEEKNAIKLNATAQQNNIDRLKVVETAEKDYRSNDVKVIEESKLALEEMKKRIEGVGGKAEENADYNKESLKIQNREFDLRLKNAGSASAREEVEKERRAAIDKQGTFLQKIASGISGIGANMKDKALAVGKGLGAIIKGTLFAGLLLAFAAFLKSPAFGATIDFIFDLIKKLGTFYDAFFGPKGSFGKGIKTLFGDESGFGLIVAGVIGLTALWAGAKLVKFFAPLTKGITRLLTGIGLIGNQLPVVDQKKNKIKSTKTPLVPDLGKDKAPKNPSKLAKFAKGGLKAAKFIPGFGLLVTAAAGLFDGVSAGLEEANKEGSTNLSVIKEASAGILSGLTFGLVEQKTISEQFDKVGNAFSTAGDKISQDFGVLKDSVVGGFNKYLGPEAQWAKDFETSLQNFKLPTLEEIGTSVKNFGADMTKEFESLTGLKVPSFDEIGKKISGFADDVKGKFTELTGVTVPSFDEVQGKLTNLGTDLSAKFEGITGIDISKSTSLVAEKLKGLASGFSIDGILGSVGLAIEKMPFKFPFGGSVKNTLLDIFPPTKADEVGDEFKGMKNGGNVMAGGAYIVGDGGKPELLVMGNQPGQIISGERSNQIMKSGSGGKTTSAPIVIASTNTNAPVNHNSTNVASNTFVVPDPMFRKNSEFAI